MYIACARIYQNTRMVHSPSVLVAAQLKPFSMLPFRHVSCSCASDFTLRNSAICCSDLIFWLSVLQMLKKSPFPETSSSVTFTFESGILVLVRVYDVAFIGYLIPLQCSGASRGGNEGRV